MPAHHSGQNSHSGLSNTLTILAPNYRARNAGHVRSCGLKSAAAPTAPTIFRLLCERGSIAPGAHHSSIGPLARSACRAGAVMRAPEAATAQPRGDGKNTFPAPQVQSACPGRRRPHASGACCSTAVRALRPPHLTPASPLTIRTARTAAVHACVVTPKTPVQEHARKRCGGPANADASDWKATGGAL